MTRGYVVITKGKAIENVARLNADAYLSGYGLEILKNISSGKICEWVQEKRDQDDPDLENFCMQWIKPKKGDKMSKYNYAEYGYVYNLNTGVLRVYYYGKLLLLVKPENIDKYLYFFEHEDSIISAFSYNAEMFNYAGSYTINVKDCLRLSLLQLQELVSQSCETRYILSDTHLIAPGHRLGHEAYYKEFSSTDNLQKKLTFTVEQNYGFWHIYLQTPFGRYIINSGKYRSEKAAMKGLRDYIHRIGNYNQIMRTADILKMYEESESDIKKGYDFINSLDKEWNTSPWWIPREKVLSVNALKSSMSYSLSHLQK